ncbi:GNAT family N-acetyltransferase [Thermoactinospora rubra]|uniref:GNAT family N-acetyltransferase n=1 Tax=Thermoactinospora rubra TaxID=1088767 RepID=UPI000A11AF03|nr:GNAT family N-acetyltransferase [Thermoactinospora rubra]
MFEEFPEPARSQLVAASEEGRTRPEWCFADGPARVCFWAPYRGADPVVTWHFEPGPDPRHGGALLRRGLAALGLRKMIHDIALKPGLTPHVDRSTEHAALLEAGFVLEVERLMLEWRAGSDIPEESGRLTYRPARELGEAALLDLLVRISEGSLDHDTRMEVATRGAEHEAKAMYDDLVHRGGKPGWFVVGYAGSSPVGLVAPDDHSIAYIGVLPEHRGRGYVHDLLARGTRTLAEAGLERIVAATDAANTPAANAFLRAGYAEVGRLYRYYWRSP